MTAQKRRLLIRSMSDLVTSHGVTATAIAEASLASDDPGRSDQLF